MKSSSISMSHEQLPTELVYPIAIDNTRISDLRPTIPDIQRTDETVFTITSLLDFVPPPSYFGHAHTQHSECPLAVVVHLLGPLLGPKELILQTFYSQRS